MLAVRIVLLSRSMLRLLLMHMFVVFKQELLYYTVPAGAMEVYRVSVEMERARAEVVHLESFSVLSVLFI